MVPIFLCINNILGAYCREDSYSEEGMVIIMKNLPAIFGTKVFNETVMKDRLPKEAYKALMKTIHEGASLELSVANVVSNAMKDWATDLGATHFTHWFQPMTGITAEKHDSFISPVGNGKVIMEFSGKELVKGEPDASSFPSGGLRATFEARGYTVWDATSYAFVKDGTLYIPTAFCSYSGEVLDKKTPLLKSMEVINEQAMRILKLFGNTSAKRVSTTAGVEQEYFLIDKDVYLKRPDLVNCGRTLIGSRPAKGQELEDHYFGSIKERVSAFMNELDEELWKLGILSKTKHNEVAPAQHEIAPIFTTANIATDHNQLIMDLAKAIANKHNMACLMHEKPFAGVNGSGKHNNWSMCTDTGLNLLEPGDTPSENAQFILVLAAIIKAVDIYQDLLRVTVASAGNDHRLGANEAPPAIVSIFLGDELSAIMKAIESGDAYTDIGNVHMELGATVLPKFPKDNTDRNRTSPFAFTGNKFEFRMVGSTFSVAGPNFVLNTAVGEILSQFADRLEKATDFNKELQKVARETLKEHGRIIFNGNNYSDEWVVEAEKRGLLNLRTTVDALPTFILPKNEELFSKHGIFTKAELHSRYEIILEGYCKTINIEALTMIDMVKKIVLPAVIGYQKEIADAMIAKDSCGINVETERAILENVSGLSATMYERINMLEAVVVDAVSCEDDILKLAKYSRDNIFSAMTKLRLVTDELEMTIAAKNWPLPTYEQLLYSVN